VKICQQLGALGASSMCEIPEIIKGSTMIPFFDTDWLQHGGVLLVDKQLENQSVAIMLAPKVCTYSIGCTGKRNERTKGKQNN
jgi:hypothetical protein